MRTMKRASGATAVALIALALGACSEAKDAADKAADDAKEKAGEAGSSIAADASGKAEDALSDATGAGDDPSATSGTAGSGDASADGSGDASADGSAGRSGDGTGEVSGVSIDLGEFADDPAAMTVGDFYSAREAVRGGGDSADLEAVTGGDLRERAVRWAEEHPPAAAFQVVVTAVDGSTVSTCVGPAGQRPRTLTVEGGKVTANTRGDFTC